MQSSATPSRYPQANLILLNTSSYALLHNEQIIFIKIQELKWFADFNFFPHCHALLPAQPN